MPNMALGRGCFNSALSPRGETMGARSSIFVFFSPSACYQRLFFLSLSRRLLIFGPFHVLSHPRRPSARSHPAVVGEGGAGGERGSLPPLYRPSNGAPWIRRAHALGAHMGTRALPSGPTSRLRRRRRGSGNEKPGHPPRMGN